MNCRTVEYKRHAVKRMAEWSISTKDVAFVLEHGEIIEDYPEDQRGHSCLMLGTVDGRPVHICVGIANIPEMCEIITVYEPTLDMWQDDYRTRRR